MVNGFQSRGWTRFEADPAVADWVTHARSAAELAVADPALAHWHVCEGTWFVGVDALPNDAAGAVGGSGPVGGSAMSFIDSHLSGAPPLHRAQVSVTWPGYPKPREGETDAAFRYRRNRDAAHVDGIKPVGPARRRHVEETHAFILGLPLTRSDPQASPLVAWEGSHQVIRSALQAAFRGIAEDQWSDTDVTDIYTAARRRVFDTCPRRELHANPGEAILLHRLTLHGIAPWAEHAQAEPQGRMVAYFRPHWPGRMSDWLNSP